MEKIGAVSNVSAQVPATSAVVQGGAVAKPADATAVVASRSVVGQEDAVSINQKGIAEVAALKDEVADKFTNYITSGSGEDTSQEARMGAYQHRQDRIEAGREGRSAVTKARRETRAAERAKRLEERKAARSARAVDRHNQIAAQKEERKLELADREKKVEASKEARIEKKEAIKEEFQPYKDDTKVMKEERKKVAQEYKNKRLTRQAERDKVFEDMRELNRTQAAERAKEEQLQAEEDAANVTPNTATSSDALRSRAAVLESSRPVEATVVKQEAAKVEQKNNTAVAKQGEQLNTVAQQQTTDANRQLGVNIAREQKMQASLIDKLAQH